MSEVLLVVDMQQDFIDGALGTPEAVAIVPHVLEKIKTFPGEIIYTQDTHQAGYAQTQEGRRLPVQHCQKGTPGWQLHPEIAKLQQKNNSLVVEKDTFGAKTLPLLLQQRYPQGIDLLEVIGLCTDLCVISNALLLKAFFPETIIWVHASCCAGVSPASHENALAAMAVCQIEIV